MNEALGEMFRYNRWANETLLAACRSLAENEFDASVAGTYGSVRETLMHLVSSQDVFLWRLSDGGPEPAGWWRDGWPGIAHLLDRSNTSSDSLLREAANLVDDAEVTLPPFQGALYRTRKSFVLLHALYHGIEHRGQVCTTLTAIGLSPPDLDGWGYAAASGAVWPVDSPGSA